MLPTSYLNFLLFARKMLDKNGLWACKNFGSGQKSSAPGDYDSATICLRVVGRVADPVRVWPDPGPTWEKWKLDQKIRYIKIKFSKRPFCEIFTPLFFFCSTKRVGPPIPEWHDKVLSNMASIAKKPNFVESSNFFLRCYRHCWVKRSLDNLLLELSVAPCSYVCSFFWLSL